MTHNTLDLTGRTFGRLTVVRREGSDRHGKATWFCRCECGGDAVVVGRSLVSGKTQACGCLRLERLRAAIVTHGATREGPRPAEYRIWQAMKTRCRNPNHVYFDRYGGRGIKVCDRWEGSYENFLADMGPRPSSRHSIDRVDNDGDYEPGNCRWATQVEQGHSYRGQESPETRLTEDDVREIRRVYAAGGVSQRALAERYGITGGAIGCIVRRETWKYV